MLITNFASGELSDTLFGRVDIPQYYSGASKIENFDVIPTGGLERRGGTERLLKLIQGDGRIIPFVVNRDLGFLIYLTPDNNGTIAVYKIENGNITINDVFFSEADLKLYKTLSEIQEVQYAQSFDTMILCHENYRPLIIDFTNNQISINNFFIDIEVDRNTHENVNTDEFFEKDNNYEINGWLDRENEWPRAVTFFNGRIIFAGTRNCPQRLFVSSIDKIRKFSTYKKFITEKRNYITIMNCNIDIGSNKIRLLEPGEISKFIKNISEYYVQSSYFSEDTMIAGLTGNYLNLINNTKDLSISESELAEFLTWKENTEDAANAASWSESLRVMSYYSLVFPQEIEIQYHALGKFRYRSCPQGNPSTDDSWINIELKNIKECVNNRNYLFNFIYERIKSNYPGTNISILDTYNQFIDNFHASIQSTMIYMLSLQGGNIVLYGTPGQIYQQILNGYNTENSNIDTVVNFYTKDYIIDSYPTPDCGFTFEIASDMNDAIKWLSVNKGLIIGTESAEWIIPPGVHATNIQAVLNSRYGSDNVQGTAIGDATCFFQSGMKALIEYYIPQQDNNFRANNMALLSDSMLRESPAKEFDFISSPYTKLFITREDGQAVSLLYERSTGTFAWSRVITEGCIKSAASLPGTDGYDELYLLVKRGEDFYLEVLRETSDVYLDSYKIWDGDISGYVPGAVIYDKNKNKICIIPENPDLETAPEIADNCYIGYPYTSRVKSMPILANDKMKPNNIKNILIRFFDSCMPKIKSYPNEQIDTITCKEPYTGVWKTIFPGGWDIDVMFELIHDKPTRCKILSIYAEVN